jgi:hypothetical protein
MLRHFALSLLFLAALPADAGAAASGGGVLQPDGETDPPEEMIDFLGRRKECARLAPEPGEVLPTPARGSWREWLRCEALPAEEQTLRRRYASDRLALAFLDAAPGEFRLGTITVNTYDGPPAGEVENAEQRGHDASGRIAWRMGLDGQAADGRATAVTVSWGRHPPRTVYLDSRMFPLLDLSSARAAVGERPDDALTIVLRYGPGRGWCGDLDGDDRSRLWLSFRPRGLQVSRQERTNCNPNYEELDARAFAAPPLAVRR